MKKNFAYSVIALVIVLFVRCSSVEEEEKTKPNIVFIFVDQLRNQSVGYNGETNITTPNIDSLAARGHVFHNALSTAPVSGPYRGMLQTGRYPANTGLFINWVDPDTTQACLAEIFNQNGYETGFIGKWHLNAGFLERNGMDYDKESTMHGEQMKGFSDPDNHSEFVEPGPYRLGYKYWAAYNFHTNFSENCYYYEDEPKKKYFEPYETDGEVSVAIEYMEKQKDEDKPFMLMIAPHVPHNPWKPEDVPEEYLAQVKDSLELRPNVKGHLIPEEHLEDWDPRVYYAMVKNIDYNIGRIMDYLKESGLVENTIVVFTSDHGEMLGSQGRVYKMVPYAESVDVPLVFYWKGKVEAGTETNSLYTPIDHMPTLLGLAGIEVPEFADGQDLSHLVLGQEGPEREEALMMQFSSHWDYCLTGSPWKEWRAVKTKQYTYVKWIDGKEELYDDIHDPYQMNDLVKEPLAREELGILRQKLKELLAKSNDEFLPGTKYREWFNDKRQVIYHE
jgi:arylsulfatase A-like enzyme